VEDLTDLLCGAEDALADEVAEAGDVLQAGGGVGVAAEDLTPCRAISATWAVPRALAIVDWYQTSSTK
jgi:hypothetical protein